MQGTPNTEIGERCQLIQLICTRILRIVTQVDYRYSGINVEVIIVDPNRDYRVNFTKK